MREKIAGYLESASRPLPAQQILREVLNIFSPNSFAADKVLTSILRGDPRFRKSAGLWNLIAQPGPRMPEAAALHLQWSAGHPGCYRGAIHFPANGVSWDFSLTEVSSPEDALRVSEGRLRAENHLLLIWTRRELHLWNRILRSFGLPEWAGHSLVVSKLADRALPRSPERRHIEDLAPWLDLAPPDSENMSAMARFLSASFVGLMEHAPADRRRTLADLDRWIAEGDAKVDFSRFAFGRDLLARLPSSPGVYLMRNRTGEVIYVGKSHNLRRRLRSYFTPGALNDAKVARIHSQLYSLEHLTCATEVEALLLEMRMIRDFRPCINLQSEIHERPSRYGRGYNLLLLVPAGKKAEVYLIRDGVFVARQSAQLGRTPPQKLRARIKTLYFGSQRRRPAAAEEWETEIVTRWISTHRKRLNLVDVDEAGRYEEVLQRLTSYLKDPDMLAAKVYYR